MKVGFVQNNPSFGNIEKNISQIERLWGNTRVDLMVLPELFTTGYQFRSAKEAHALAEPVPDGPTCKWLQHQARVTQSVIVAGLVEMANDKIYNSAAIVGPGGLLGVYRKAHLFDTEKNIFQPGNLPLPVIDIGPARVGVMICFDWRFPETARTLSLQGADIIAHPSNLVLSHCPQAMITRCLENRVFAITADRVGQEERIPGQALDFLGQSQIVDPDGNILYRASSDKEEIHILEIDIQLARDKCINEKNNLFEDRREDLYRIQ